MTIDNQADLLKLVRTLKKQVDKLEKDVTGLIGSRVAFHEELFETHNKVNKLSDRIDNISIKTKRKK